VALHVVANAVASWAGNSYHWEYLDAGEGTDDADAVSHNGAGVVGHMVRASVSLALLVRRHDGPEETTYWTLEAPGTFEVPVHRPACTSLGAVGDLVESLDGSSLARRVWGC
jgi:hypothetical protein